MYVHCSIPFSVPYSSPAIRDTHSTKDFLDAIDYLIPLQIEHQSKFLWHPLVESFIFHKFWTMTFPLLLLNLLFYFILLVALNVFALVVPRPGPNSDTCKKIISEPLILILLIHRVVLCMRSVVSKHVRTYIGCCYCS